MISMYLWCVGPLTTIARQVNIHNGVAASNVDRTGCRQTVRVTWGGSGGWSLYNTVLYHQVAIMKQTPVVERA